MRAVKVKLNINIIGPQAKSKWLKGSKPGQVKTLLWF